MNSAGAGMKVCTEAKYVVNTHRSLHVTKYRCESQNMLAPDLLPPEDGYLTQFRFKALFSTQIEANAALAHIKLQ